MSEGPGGGPAWGRVALASALLALAGATTLAAAGHDPFVGWYYHFAWYPTLLAADAGLQWRDGRSPLLGRPRLALSLFLWSIPAWLLFEALNFRIANWYYVLAEPEPLLRRLATALAFATVLPAVYLAHRWLNSFGLAADWRTRPIGWPARHPRLLLLLGLAFAALALWRPLLFFPLVWGAVTLLLEPFNLRRDPSRSLVADLAAGRPGRIVRLLAAGGAVGILWESFNALARTRWIYTVPWLEGAKLFEMPLPGYLGFPVFALDCFVIYGALVNAGVAVAGWGGRHPLAEPIHRLSPPRVLAAAALALLGSLAVMRGMDRWTVDSYHGRLADLPGLGPTERARLEAAGVSDPADLADAASARLSTRIDAPPRAVERWIRLARLARTRGIGLANALALEDAGIGSACALAAATPEAVRQAVRAARDDPNAGHPRRVRVWLRAARAACPEGSSGTATGRSSRRRGENDAATGRGRPSTDAWRIEEGGMANR